MIDKKLYELLVNRKPFTAIDFCTKETTLYQFNVICDTLRATYPDFDYYDQIEINIQIKFENKKQDMELVLYYPYEFKPKNYVQSFVPNFTNEIVISEKVETIVEPKILEPIFNSEQVEIAENNTELLIDRENVFVETINAPSDVIMRQVLDYNKVKANTLNFEDKNPFQNIIDEVRISLVKVEEEKVNMPTDIKVDEKVGIVYVEENGKRVPIKNISNNFLIQVPQVFLNSENTFAETQKTQFSVEDTQYYCIDVNRSGAFTLARWFVVDNCLDDSRYNLEIEDQSICLKFIADGLLTVEGPIVINKSFLSLAGLDCEEKLWVTKTESKIEISNCHPLFEYLNKRLKNKLIQYKTVDGFYHVMIFTKIDTDGNIFGRIGKNIITYPVNQVSKIFELN